MNRSFRGAERWEIGSLKIKDNKGDDLALFREMRKHEKERNDLLLFQNSHQFDISLGPVTSATPAPVQKNRAFEFLNSDNDKNDYDWLITPPGTPLLPSLEKESQRTVMSQTGTPKARPTAFKSRLANPQPEAAGRINLSSRHLASALRLNPSSGLRKPVGPGSRPATPTGRPTMSSIHRSISTSASNKTTLTIPSKPSRSTTPTRSTLPSSRSSALPRSSTPNASRPSIPALKSTSRAMTPARRPNIAPSTIKSANASSVVKTTVKKNPVQSRPSSPTVRPRPWNPSEMLGFSLDVPPNLRTSVSDRLPSATRGRPGYRSSSVEPVSNGRTRRQSCSPVRGRPPNGITHSSGSSVPVITANCLHAKANDNVSPSLVGTKTVERVISMRKLVPVKKDGKQSPRSNLSRKSCSTDSSGFGRTFSNKSMDMAIRHMDVGKSIKGNLQPLLSNVPASSMYSVRSVPTRSRTVSVSYSRLETSSTASSEVSVNNNSVLCRELDDVTSKRIRSAARLHDR